MSRTGTGEVIAAPRSSNIYTILAAVGLVVVLLSLVVVWNRATTLFDGLLTAPPQGTMRAK